MKTSRITISTKDKLTLISNLSTMITAGISILHAVDSLLVGKKGNIRKILEEVRADLLQGKQLHFSFAKFPRVFDSVIVNMLKASEEAGTFDVTLRELKEQIKKDMEFSSRVRNAALYPLVVFGVFIGVLLLILIVVIPKIATVFSQLKVKLPLPTRIMLGVSTILTHYTLFVILGLLIVVVSFLLLYLYKKHLVLSVVYSLPFVSSLIREIDLVRFSRCMHLLLSSGITITNALELTERVVIKKESSRAIAFARSTVISGKNISVAFKARPKVFPEMVVTLVEVGEKTGTLDKSLLDVSEFYDSKVTDSLKNLTTLLEPIMLVIVGIMVGGMMFAFIGPIYGLIGHINPK